MHAITSGDVEVDDLWSLQLRETRNVNATCYFKRPRREEGEQKRKGTYSFRYTFKLATAPYKTSVAGLPKGSQREVL